MTAEEPLVVGNPTYQSLDDGSVNLPLDTSFTVSNLTFQDHEPSCQEREDDHQYDKIIPVTLLNHDIHKSVDESDVPAA